MAPNRCPCQLRSLPTLPRLSRSRSLLLQVNACLIPVVLGVALASAAELQFTWDCFAFAMGSNIAFALRGVLTKKLSTKPKVRCKQTSYSLLHHSLLAVVLTN